MVFVSVGKASLLDTGGSSARWGVDGRSARCMPCQSNGILRWSLESELADSETIPESEHPLLAGRYRVVRRLGSGGMGEVFLVEDLKLDGRRFAVKMLPAFLAGDRRAMASLKREALHSMELSHPNIVTVRSFEESSSGQPFLVMDFIDGQTLADLLAAEGRLPESEVLRIFGPIAEALDYAHSKGVVHRDVKPSNIMIRRDGAPVIMDFGVAREAKDTSTLATGLEMASGTLPYMSPEQLRGDRPAPAQDVYSLAATIWEALVGRPPFHRGDLRFQIMNESPVLPLGQEVDGGLVGRVIRGLEKDGSKRPSIASLVSPGASGRIDQDESIGMNEEENLEIEIRDLEGILRDHFGIGQSSRSQIFALPLSELRRAAGRSRETGLRNYRNALQEYLKGAEQDLDHDLTARRRSMSSFREQRQAVPPASERLSESGVGGGETRSDDPGCFIYSLAAILGFVMLAALVCAAIQI